MNYLIGAGLFIFIIVLIFAFRTSKKKKPAEVSGQEVVVSEVVEEKEVSGEEAAGEAEVEVSVTVEDEAEQYTPPDESEAAVEEVEEEGEDEEALAGPVVDEPAEAELEESEEVPSEITLEKYIAHLVALEEKIRRELDWAIKNRETIKRTLLEPKLLVVCEMQAAVEDNFNRIKELIADTGKVLEQVQGELSGFDFDTMNRQLQLGEFEVVEAILSEVSSQLDDDTELASGVYYARGQLAEELLEYFGAYENYRKAYAADPDNQTYLMAAGRTARIIGNDQDAQFWMEKLVRMGIEKDEKTLEQSIAQHELGLVCVRTDQKEKGGALFKRSIAIKEQVLGREHQDLGPVMHDYAVLLEGNGMYEQAENLYRRSIEVTEKGLGDDYPRLGSSLNKLAGVYEEMELADRSEPLYLRALAIKENVLGREHLDVGTILNNLAELMRRQGRHEEAEPLFMRSLDIMEKELGPDHPNLTIVLNNLAELYSAMGREEEATQYQERAFSLFELPGMSSDFVEMEKSEDFGVEDDKDQSVT